MMGYQRINRNSEFRWKWMVLGVVAACLYFIDFTGTPMTASLMAESLVKDQVNFLPGFGVPLEKQYSSLVQVNDDNGTIFYWFFEARPAELKTNDATPLFIWLNGGPGASSMTGAFTEMGPYRIQTNGTLKMHPYSWTMVGHMLFFDQPVGTGYTSCNTDAGYVRSQEQMAQQLYIALMQFYTRHPEYRRNPLIICGESYAGKYVPYISHFIHRRRLAGDDINLHGVAIGNGIMWPVLQSRSVPDYAIALGLIDQRQFDYAMAQMDVCARLHELKRHVEAFQVCQSMEDKIYQEYAGNPFVYDVRQKGNPFNVLTQTLSEYFNSDPVREALHVGHGTKWTSIDGSSYGASPNSPPLARHLLQDEMLDVPNEIFKDLIENYKFMFYAGNMDGSSCNNLGIARMIDRLVWNRSEEYHLSPRRVWKLNNQTVGLVRQLNQFVHVVVTNSGHLVPTDQPLASLDMISRFASDLSFS